MNEKFTKRIIMFLIAISMILTALPVNVFADENLSTDLVTHDEIEQSHIELEELSAEDLEIVTEIIENAISVEEKEDPNFNEVEFVEDVEAFLEGDANHFIVDKDDSEKEGIFAAIENFFFIRANAATKKGRINISNKVVAVGVNAVVSLAIGGATTYAIRALVLKKGATYVTNLLVKKVVSKLLAIGIKEVTGVGTLIRTVVKNALDPGSTVARYLDRRDRYPRNGFVDITS